MEKTKLYKYLLVKPEILDADPDFINFWALKRSEDEKQYRKLFSKYAAALTVLGCYKHHFSKRIETIWAERKKLLERSKNKETELNKLIEPGKGKLDQGEVNALLRYQIDRANKKDKRQAESIQNDKETLDDAYAAMKLNIEIYMDTFLADQLEMDIKEYQKAIGRIGIIEKAFYKSYGFFAKIEENTVLCNEEKLIRYLNFIYFYNIHKKEKWAYKWKSKVKYKGDEEYMQAAERLNKELGIEEPTIGQRESKDWFVFDVLKKFVKIDDEEINDEEIDDEEIDDEEIDDEEIDDEEIDDEESDDEENIKRYLDAKELAVLRKESQKFEQDAEGAVAIIKKGIKELVEYANSKRYEAIDNDNDRKLIMDTYVNLINEYLTKIRDMRDGYFRAFALGDAEYEKISKYYDKLDECIRAYNSFRNSPNVKIKNERQRLEIKEAREKNWENKKEKFEEIIKTLDDMQELRRNSMAKVFSRLYRVSKVQARLENSGIKDVDLDLYKSLFKRLKESVKKEVANVFKDEAVFGYMEADKTEDNEMQKKDDRDSEKTGLNGMYMYGDMGILTLNFLNTRMEKYRTAIVIVDEEDLKRIVIQSQKSAWTFKGGKEINKSIYGYRAYKPDKIVENNGRVSLAEHIMKVDPKETECFLKSHKFDFRKSCIGIGKEEGKAWKKVEKEKYYTGEIWIGDSGDDETVGDNKGKKLDAETTVCINWKDNVNGASILYFDDSESLKDFLASI